MGESGTKALNRGLDILFALAESSALLSVEEIAQRTSIPESTTYRLLQTLEERGLVQRHGRGQVGMGSALLALARATRKQIETDLVEIARPYMRDLTARTGETSLLNFRLGMNAVCVESIDSDTPVRLHFEKGNVFPLHSGASALALLAYLESDVIEQIVTANEGAQYAHGGEVTREGLVRAIERIRRDGYAVTVGERDAWAAGVAAPIRGVQGQVLASLCLAGPKDRFSEDVLPGLIEDVMGASRAIEDRMRHVAT